jgi:hypothetical protein
MHVVYVWYRLAKGPIILNINVTSEQQYIDSRLKLKAYNVCSDMTFSSLSKP